MQKFIVAGLIALASSSVAHADGTNAVKVQPAPAPLQTQAPVSHTQHIFGAPTHQTGPAVHYGTSRRGTAVTTSYCGTADAVTCAGNYVTTGRVIRTETMPAYTETVQPVIWAAGTWPGQRHELDGGHHDASPYCTMPNCSHHGAPSKPHEHHHKTPEAKLDGAAFNGGVGSGVGGGYWSTGNTVIVQSGYSGRTSVMSHPSARFTMKRAPRTNHTCCRR